MFDKLVSITEFLWGTPLMILMVGVGLYLTIGTGFFQIRKFGTVLKKTIGEVFSKNSDSAQGEGQLKPYQALSTVLAGPSAAATSPAWRRPSPWAAPAPCSGCGSSPWWA